MRNTIRVVAFLSIIAIPTGAANKPPVVNAGPDTTLRLGYSYIVKGTAVDDSVPNDTLRIAWSQVAGPAGGVSFSSPQALWSGVSFSFVGTYTLALSAFDGATTVIDSVNIAVLDSIPFRVLTPQTGARIAKGSSFPVTWQVDPAVDVQVQLSTDNGMTFENLSGTVVSGDTAWVWQVSDTLTPSDSCFIRVRKYFQRTKWALSGKFSLVPASGVLDGRYNEPAGLSLDRTQTFFTLDGRCLRNEVTISERKRADGAIGVGLSSRVKEVRVRK